MQLIAENVLHQYSGDISPVLNEISLTVGQGERVAIMGPSGSGKTTLISILGGLLKPSEGRSFVRSESLHAPSHNWVAWVFQTANFLPDRSTQANVAVGALSDGRSWTESQIAAIQVLSQIGLASKANSPARNLSGGETQRMTIARAIATSRPFILADEPTGQMDQKTSLAALDILMAVDDRGVVVCTHDPLVAERCKRIYRLINGQLVAV